MNKKKTILFIIPKLGSGGAERVIANLCQRLEDFEKYVVIFEKEIKYEVKANISTYLYFHQKIYFLEY